VIVTNITMEILHRIPRVSCTRVALKRHIRGFPAAGHSYHQFVSSPSPSCSTSQWPLAPNYFRREHHQTYHTSTPLQYSKNKQQQRLRPISLVKDKAIIDEIPLEDIRNFCFIAHVDHGKSSLASRVLELTGNLGIDHQLTSLKHAGLLDQYIDIGKDGSDGNIENENNSTADTKEQIDQLDTLSVERERGITVKASAASMLFPHQSAKGKHGVLLLNMVDTPGHIDFGTEVSRTLSSVQGAVLLFDAAQGPQAQSLSVHEKAKQMENVKAIIPVLTKMDLPAARSMEVALSVSDLFDFDPDSIILSSARSRIGISEVLEAVCTGVPSPQPLPDDDGKTVRILIVDSWFEPLRGVVCLVQVLSGKIEEGSRVNIIEPHVKEAASDTSEGNAHVYNLKDHFSLQEIGLILPQRVRTGTLARGQMGYMIAGLRDPRQARPGTIMTTQKDLPTAVNMYLPQTCFRGSEGNAPSSVLYASVHPMEGDGFDELAAAVDRLALNDTGLEINKTSGNSNNDGGPYLGPGLRVGFQGLLHVEVFQQRLEDEHGLEALVTPPKVPYRVRYLESNSHKRPAGAPEVEIIEDLSRWPAPGVRFKVEEPYVDCRIIAPFHYAGNIMELISKKRGLKMETKPIDELTWLFTATLPFRKVVTSFFDELKNCSAGYASFDHKESDPLYREANLCKVEILLNSDLVEPLSFVCHKDVGQEQGRSVCKKLQSVLPRQQFVTVIQAKADSKIIASERIRAYRKDVLTTGGSKSVGGGDVSRKKKLLEKQKKGKKRQQASGKVSLSQAAFNSVIKRS